MKSDLELIRRCALALGWDVLDSDPRKSGRELRHPFIQLISKETGFRGTSVAHWIFIPYPHEGVSPNYDPLRNDKQAMELLKSFPGQCLDSLVAHYHNSATLDLNRVIVERVARLAGKP